MKMTDPSINKSACHHTMAQLADHLRQTFALMERGARKARREAKTDHLKASNQPSRGRAARKSPEPDLMVTIVRAVAKAARQRASLRARQHLAAATVTRSK